MQREKTGLIQRNLAALAKTSPSLAALIERSEPNPLLAFRRAKNGAVVPVLRGGSGEQPLHSLVDPDKEAERIVRSQGDIGYLVCLGLGGGSVASAFLRQPHASGLLVIEKDPATLKALLGNIALAPVLSDARVRVTTGLEEISGILRASYIPAVSGNLASLAVRPWCAAEHQFFDAAAQELRLAAEEARADHRVQAAFGKRWFANILLNLPAAERVPMRQVPEAWTRSGVAHVTAAGPSLEEALSMLSARKDGSIIIATDTSLPALMRNGVQPDIVMSLDCQVYSYHHFLGGLPRASALFFDLASPPFLVRHVGARSRFFTSAHPFARFISATWRPFPLLDTTGGNVTHAAVSLAGTLGISTVRLHGADFSYPDAKPYARGTYLYDYFLARQWRCMPLEASLASFVLGSAGLTAERSVSGIRYTTAVLQDYKARLKMLMGKIPAKTTGADHPDALVVTPARCPWSDFLRDYAEAVRALPAPSTPLGLHFAALMPSQRELWATLLPVAARLMRETQGTVSNTDCLEGSRQWALGSMERMLRPGAQGL
jgi:6-hydroxymethylpterin diphosphokinase MptE-like